MQQAFLALMRLLVHVRDLDAADRAARDTERQRAAGVVGVHVHLERRAIADDEQRVAELLELRFERIEIEVVAFDDEDRAVAVLRQLLMDRVDADLLLPFGRLGQRLAADGGCDAAHDLDEAGRAGIDDAGLAEHRQHLARRRHGLVAGRNDLRQRRTSLCGVGHQAHRGQHRPLHGLLDRTVGSVARRAERLREVVGLARATPSRRGRSARG